MIEEVAVEVEVYDALGTRLQLSNGALGAAYDSTSNNQASNCNDGITGSSGVLCHSKNDPGKNYVLFAFSTIIAWSYYGLKAFTYLIGDSYWADLGFKLFFLAFVVVGSSVELSSLVELSDALVFIVAIPNLLGLYLLAPIIKAELLKYEKRYFI